MFFKNYLAKRVSHNLLIPILVFSFALYLSTTVRAQSAMELDQYGRWVNGISEPWWFPESVAKEEVETVKARWSAINIEGPEKHQEADRYNYYFGW